MSRKKAVRAIIIKDGSLLTFKRNKFGMQYYILVGGGVGIGEDLETALRREVREETSLEVGTVRPVFVEDAGDLYGEQHVYLCEYIGGEAAMPPDSEEAIISAGGLNLYEPVWLELSDLATVPFRSGSVREAILEATRSGFPDTPQTLAWRA